MLGTFLDNLHFYTPSKLGHTSFSGGFVTVYHKRHWSQMFPHKYDRFVGKIPSMKIRIQRMFRYCMFH